MADSRLVSRCAALLLAAVPLLACSPKSKATGSAGGDGGAGSGEDHENGGGEAGDAGTGGPGGSDETPVMTRLEFGVIGEDLDETTTPSAPTPGFYGVATSSDGQVVVRTAGPIPTYPAVVTVAPSNDHMAYVDANDGQLKIQATTPGATATTISGSEVTADSVIGWAGFSPDGQTLFYDVDTTLYRVNVDGTGRALLGHGWGYTVQFSPDGRRMVFEGMDGVHVGHADGTSMGLASNGDHLWITRVRWSGSGEYVAFISREDDDEEPQVWVVDRDGGNKTRISDPSQGEASQLDWGHERIAYTAWDGSDMTLYLGNVDGSPATPLGSMNDYSRNFDVSPDDGQVAWVVGSDEDGGALMVANASDGIGVERATGDLGEIQWTPSQSRLLFQMDESLYTLPDAMGDPVPIEPTGQGVDTFFSATDSEGVDHAYFLTHLSYGPQGLFTSPVPTTDSPEPATDLMDEVEPDANFEVVQRPMLTGEASLGLSMWILLHAADDPPEQVVFAFIRQELSGFAVARRTTNYGRPAEF